MRTNLISLFCGDQNDPAFIITGKLRKGKPRDIRVETKHGTALASAARKKQQQFGIIPKDGKLYLVWNKTGTAEKSEPVGYFDKGTKTFVRYSSSINMETSERNAITVIGGVYDETEDHLNLLSSQA